MRRSSSLTEAKSASYPSQTPRNHGTTPVFSRPLTPAMLPPIRGLDSGVRRMDRRRLVGNSHHLTIPLLFPYIVLALDYVQSGFCAERSGGAQRRRDRQPFSRLLFCLVSGWLAPRMGRCRLSIAQDGHHALPPLHMRCLQLRSVLRASARVAV